MKPPRSARPARDSRCASTGPSSAKVLATTTPGSSLRHPGSSAMTAASSAPHASIYLVNPPSGKWRASSMPVKSTPRAAMAPTSRAPAPCATAILIAGGTGGYVYNSGDIADTAGGRRHRHRHHPAAARADGIFGARRKAGCRHTRAARLCRPGGRPFRPRQPADRRQRGLAGAEPRHRTVAFPRQPCHVQQLIWNQDRHSHQIIKICRLKTVSKPFFNFFR